MKFSKIKYIIIFNFILLTACSQNISDSQPDKPLDSHIEQMKSFLAENGFPENLIKSYDSYFLIDEDILITKSEVKEFLSGKKKQAHGGSGWGLVDIANSSNITVKAHSSVPTSWKNAIEDAIDNWNSIYNTELSFSFETSGATDITVYSDIYLSGGLPYYVIAAGTPPSSGEPGNSIYINLDYTPLGGGSVTSSSKIYNMVHELGHNIGFRHTNWASNPNEPSATTIPRTPTSDSNSIMNSGTADNNWNGFSSYDKIGTKILYPTYAGMVMYTPVVQENGFGAGRFVDLTWANIHRDTALNYKLYRKEGVSGSWEIIATFNSSPLPGEFTDYVTAPFTGSTTYYYKINATFYLARGNESFSRVVSANVSSSF